VNRGEDLPTIAPGQIGASDALTKECVSGYKFAFGGDPKTHASLRMTRCVKHVESRGAKLNLETVPQFCIDGRLLRSLDPQPARLHVDVVVEDLVQRVHEHGSAGERLEFGGSADMVDMRVGDDNRLAMEARSRERLFYHRNVVAGIDDDGFSGFRVAKNRAIAL